MEKEKINTIKERGNIMEQVNFKSISLTEFKVRGILNWRIK